MSRDLRIVPQDGGRAARADGTRRPLPVAAGVGVVDRLSRALGIGVDNGARAMERALHSMAGVIPRVRSFLGRELIGNRFEHDGQRRR
jgi:hypothetical protein